MFKKNKTWIFIAIPLLILCNCRNISNKEIAKDGQKRDSLGLHSSLKNIWELDGKNGISWNVEKESHTDHVEFSGLRVSGIITYGVDNHGQLVLSKQVVWPMLRLLPNDTHASLIHEFDNSISPRISVNGEKISNERPYKISFNGILSICSRSKNVEIRRQIFPSTDKPSIVEIINIKNTSRKEITIKLDELDYQEIVPDNQTVYGRYTILASNKTAVDQRLMPGEEVSRTVIYAALKGDDQILIDGKKEKDQREKFINSIYKSLDLETPDLEINQMFRFAKIRAAESIFATKGGLMHGPGGGRYYAAIWANDQAEYVNPFLPFLGYKIGNESAINSYRHFARFVNPDFNPIPSSIIAEGEDIWNGAGDRGDAAMIAYGASRFALAYGNRITADSLLPLIEWCLQYCEQKMLPEGVIASDCDELENRFPAGEANLSTNMLAYGAYKAAANVFESLNPLTMRAEYYRHRANEIRQNCDKYFGGEIQGYNTYRYYKGNVKLRSWICMPLVMGIKDRKEETLKALLSPLLWSKDGIYTEAGDSTFWDRSTLYAFRGIFFAGETDLAMDYFKYYSKKRLLGEHVPYAVEAYPEGNQRHLSAESALFCRVITEGLFGIEPTGFRTFNLSPRMPTGWDHMNLRRIKAFGDDFDIEVFRIDDDYKVQIIRGEEIIFDIIWNGEQHISISL